MLYLTQQERRAQINYDDEPQKGLKIQFPNGAIHFLPGSSFDFAWTLAENSEAREWLTHPQTKIEYGERHKGRFTTERVIKSVVEGT